MPFFEILQPVEGLYKDKGSKFYAFAFPVKNKADIDTHLAAIRRKYYDARHHCYAYRMGKEGELSFVNDDGEPAHTAGDPILGQIRNRDLTNTLVIVIRYFGGILLGVRGLIEAYKGAAADALDQAKMEEIIPIFRFTLRFPYDKTAEISRLLHPFPTTIIAAEYGIDCFITYQVRKELTAQIRHTFYDAFGFVYKELEEEE
jgi:uncharacterized YigZ family protein